MADDDNDDDDVDDDDDNDDELFLWNGRWIKPFFQTGSLSEVFTIVDILTTLSVVVG